MQSSPSDPPATVMAVTRWKGLLRREPCWRLTRRGWVVAALLLVVLGVVCLRCVHPFLAVEAPVPSEVLVVEGWVADYALRAAVGESERRTGSMIYVTGGPLERGAPLSEYQNYSVLGAAVMEEFGAPTNRLRAVPAPKVRRDRTYAAALALRDWFEAHGGLPPALNVVTIGPHARRSRLLYEKAFGEECKIGVITVSDEDYDARRWWAYSQGVRSVMSETVSYLYSRLLFRVSMDRRGEKESGEDSVESSP